MEVLRPDGAPTFLELAGPLLERDEARNQLPLGIAGTISARPDAYDVVHFWVVRDGGEPVAAAVRTEPFNLVLGDPSSDAALPPCSTRSWRTIRESRASSGTCRSWSAPPPTLRTGASERPNASWPRASMG